MRLNLDPLEDPSKYPPNSPDNNFTSGEWHQRRVIAKALREWAKRDRGILPPGAYWADRRMALEVADEIDPEVT